MPPSDGTVKYSSVSPGTPNHVSVYCSKVMCMNVRVCIQKLPDWPPGARTANGTVSSLPLDAVASLFRESV
jgi:hypothetical protein